MRAFCCVVSVFRRHTGAAMKHRLAEELCSSRRTKRSGDEAATRETGGRATWCQRRGRCPTTPANARLAQIQICGRKWRRSGIKQPFLLAGPRSDAAPDQFAQIKRVWTGIHQLLHTSGAGNGPRSRKQPGFHGPRQLSQIYAGFVPNHPD